MNSLQSKEQQKPGNPTGNHKGNPTGNHKNLSSTGGKATPKRECNGNNRCNDYHCPRLTSGEGHHPSYTRPTSCWMKENRGSCTKCDPPRPNVCQFGVRCNRRETCTKEHPSDASQAQAQAAPTLEEKDFPFLPESSLTESTTRLAVDNCWAKGGFYSPKTESKLQKGISDVLSCFPNENFASQLPLLKVRLDSCKTDQDFLSLLEIIKAAFDSYVTSASSLLDSDEIAIHKLMELFQPFMKNIFNAMDDEFPELPENIIDAIMVPLHSCDKFTSVFNEITSTLSVVEESSNTSVLITTVSQLTDAIRQLERILSEITSIDMHAGAPVSAMIVMLKATSASNISSMKWCSSDMINGVSRSATQLLEEIKLQKIEKDKQENARIRELLMNPNYEIRNPNANFMAYLYGISFHFGNLDCFSKFLTSLDKHHTETLTTNMGKFFKCLVTQIYKNLVSKPEDTKKFFDEKNQKSLTLLLESAMNSMIFDLNQNPENVLKFLQIFKDCKTDLLSQNFVDFLYTIHRFPGNEGNQPMSKLLNWHLTNMKDYFGLDIHRGDDFQITIYVSEDVIDDKGNTSHIKVDITNMVMDCLFNLLCYSEVCRVNKMKFPYGNMSNENSLATLFNKIGSGSKSNFQEYRKRTTSAEEQRPAPYDPSFKTAVKANSNSNIVDFFLSNLLINLREQLDEEFHQKLENVEKSFSPPGNDFSKFYIILALYGSKENASISGILKGIQVLLSKSDSNLLMSLLKDDFSSLSDPLTKTATYFLNSHSESDAKSVSEGCFSGMRKLMDVIMTSGINVCDITTAHGMMRKIYMKRKSELYLHQCLIAIIIALTRKYKITFQDVYNMICTAMKNQKWISINLLDERNPMRKAISDLQIQRKGDFSFEKLVDSDRGILTNIDHFLFDSMFRNVKSTETEENMKIVKDLIESVVPLILFDEAHSKIISNRPSSMIDLLNTALGFRLTGDTFKKFMSLFGINVGDIVKDNSHSPPSNPKDLFEAFNMDFLRIISELAKSKYDDEVMKHKKENPDFLTTLSRYERSSANKKIRNNVRDHLINLLIKTGFGFTSISLDDLLKIRAFDLFNAVKVETNQIKLEFFKDFFKAIYDGVYANTFFAFQARKDRFTFNTQFLESLDGEKCDLLTFAGQIVDESGEESDAEYMNIDQVFLAIKQLLESNDIEYSIFKTAITSFPPMIMNCRDLRKLFPQNDEDPTEFHKQHSDTFHRFIGNLMDPEMGGISAFEEFCRIPDEEVPYNYAELIGFGYDENYKGLSLKSYERFLYLLCGLRHFLVNELNDIIGNELNQ